MNSSPDIRISTKVFTGGYPFSGLTEMAISLKIMGGERPARPPGAQELGLTDSVWNMTCKCWRQDPARRPTVTEVVGLLREWFSLSMEPTSRHTPRSYKQRTVNTPSSNLAPRPLVKNADVTADHALISKMPSNGNPAPTKPSGTPQRSDQTNVQTHKPSSDISPVLGSPCEPLSDGSHTPPGTTTSDDEHPQAGYVDAATSNKSRTPSGTGNPNCD